MTQQLIHDNYLKRVRSYRRKKWKKSKKNFAEKILNFIKGPSSRVRQKKLIKTLDKWGLLHKEGISHVINLYSQQIRPANSEMILGIGGLVLTSLLFIYQPYTQITEKIKTDDLSSYVDLLGGFVFTILLLVLFVCWAWIRFINDHSSKWMHALELLNSINTDLIRNKKN